MSFPLQISSQGRIEAQFPVINREADPTMDTVEIAYLARGTRPDGSETWNTGSWDTSAIGPVYLAQCLTGTSPGVELATGDFDAYVRISTGDEQPVLGPYQVTVY